MLRTSCALAAMIGLGFTSFGYAEDVAPARHDDYKYIFPLPPVPPDLKPPHAQYNPTPIRRYR